MNFPSAMLDQLRAATRVAVLTGAGISAESGVPTFRDAQTGLWAKFKPEDLATRGAFRGNPKLVWEWYALRRQKVASVAPNPGHLALVEMEKRFPQFTLVTQNVDGLHQRAGSRNVLELHGNLTRVKCFDDDELVASWDESKEIPPRCPRCGGWLRPDVVWFGESLPPAALAVAERASQTCDVFLSIGTSAVVYPAADLPLSAVAAGATLIEINPDATPLTPRAAYSLRGPAGVILPELLQSLWPA